MTDGEKVISEGSLGRDNYKTTRALGWLMEIDGGGWVACVGNRRSKPLPLNKAKDAARDMHRSGSGEAPDDLIRALNLATAGQIDREARKSQGSTPRIGSSGASPLPERCIALAASFALWRGSGLLRLFPTQATQPPPSISVSQPIARVVL